METPIAVARRSDASPYMTGRQAMLRLNLGRNAVQRLALLGRIRVLMEPGASTRFNREDVEKIASETSA